MKPDRKGMCANRSSDIIASSPWRNPMSRKFAPRNWMASENLKPTLLAGVSFFLARYVGDLGLALRRKQGSSTILNYHALGHPGSPRLAFFPPSQYRPPN